MKDMSAAQAIANQVEKELGDTTVWRSSGPEGYPDSLALCVIDSVYSLRAKYSSVVNVLNRYRDYRREQGGDPNTDGTDELLSTLSERSGSDLFGNETMSPGTSIRKYDTIEAAAQALSDFPIRTTASFRDALQDNDTYTQVKKRWLAVKGLGPASWHYLVILAGAQDVKADTWINRFVARALERQVSSEESRTLVLHAAEILRVEARALDHGIWQHERSREDAS